MKPRLEAAWNIDPFDGSNAALLEEKMKKFHAHLDTCKQCEKNPFSLCSVGSAIMEPKP